MPRPAPPTDLLRALADATRDRGDVAEAFTADAQAARTLLALAAMTERLLGGDPASQADLEASLGVLGRTLGCDSVAVWRLRDAEVGRYDIHARWRRHAAPLPDTLIVGEWDLDEVHEQLLAGELVEVWRTTARPRARALLESVDDEALLMVPITTEHGTWGTALFALPLGATEPWTPLARACLRAMAAVTAGAVRRAEERARAERLRVALEAADRQESLATLAAGVAHDLKNVLNVMRAGLEMVEVRGELIDTDRERLERSLDTAGALARQLYTFAGIDDPRREPVDLRRLLRRGRWVLNGRIPEALTITEDLPDDLPMVWGDHVQVGQAIGNLVLNAVEAVDPVRGHIHVEAVSQVRDGVPGVRLSVADDGPGVPEDLRRRLFDPLVSTKGARRGIGLASAASIARTHGGTLRHSDRPGGGARFDLWLPTCEAEARRADG